MVPVPIQQKPGIAKGSKSIVNSWCSSAPNGRKSIGGDLDLTSDGLDVIESKLKDYVSVKQSTIEKQYNLQLHNEHVRAGERIKKKEL